MFDCFTAHCELKFCRSRTCCIHNINISTHDVFSHLNYWSSDNIALFEVTLFCFFSLTFAAFRTVRNCFCWFVFSLCVFPTRGQKLFKIKTVRFLNCFLTTLTWKICFKKHYKIDPILLIWNRLIVEHDFVSMILFKLYVSTNVTSVKINLLACKSALEWFELYIVKMLNISKS